MLITTEIRLFLDDANKYVFAHTEAGVTHRYRVETIVYGVETDEVSIYARLLVACDDGVDRVPSYTTPFLCRKLEDVPEMLRRELERRRDKILA